MKNDPPHVALAKARILADLRYIDTWKADLIRAILLAEKPDEADKSISPLFNKRGLFRDETNKLNKSDSYGYAKR